MTAARQQILNKQQLNSNIGTVFSVRSVPRYYNRAVWSNELNCELVCEAKTKNLV
jgi:hypothetical protein